MPTKQSCPIPGGTRKMRYLEGEKRPTRLASGATATMEGVHCMAVLYDTGRRTRGEEAVGNQKRGFWRRGPSRWEEGNVSRMGREKRAGRSG